MTASARQVETSAELCCKQDGSARGKREKLKGTETLTENDYGNNTAHNREGIMFLGCLVFPFVHLSSQISLARYLMNDLNSFDKIDGEYSLAPTDDLIRFWRSKVKVTAGRPVQIL